MYKLALLVLVVVVSGCEFSKDLNVENIKGYQFSLHDIQENCTVKRDGDQHLAINCKNDQLRPLMRGCEGQMTAGLEDPKFYCSGGLWMLNDICYIDMLDTSNGNLRCRKQ